MAVNQIFNGLVELDNELSIKPCIAKLWTISDDGKLYTFILRDDVYFHKNEIFTETRNVVSSDFVYSFNRILNPKVASPGTWVFQNIAINEETGEKYIFAVDDTTLVIKLENPFPPFLGLLSMQYCSVVYPEAVEHYGSNFRNNPIGTGPFRFKYWKENVKLVLLKNEDYFEFDTLGDRLPYLDAINITFIVDKQTAFMNFLKGNIDFISGIDATCKDALLDKRGNLREQFHSTVIIKTEPYLNTEYLGFLLDSTKEGFKHDVLSDIRIRQAINHCFDRKKMIQHLRNNIGIPGIYGFVPLNMPGFTDFHVKGYDYNPQKSRELLKQAGYPNGDGLADIILTTTPAYVDLCQYIQHEASKVGITIKIDVTQPATLREMNANSRVPFFRASWIADYPDAENYLSLFYSENLAPLGPNYTQFKDKYYDEIFRKAIKTTDDSERYALYKKLDSIAMSKSPVIVLYYDQVLRFIRKGITGLESNPMNILCLKRVDKILNGE